MISGTLNSDTNHVFDARDNSTYHSITVLHCRTREQQITSTVQFTITMTPRPLPQEESPARTTGMNASVNLTEEEAEKAIVSLQALLRYPTVSATAPDTGAYVECAAYLMEQLRSISTLTDIHILPESPHHSPVVVACWKGLSPELPVILLNSHYDVVPASDEWTVPPFQGLRKEGRIYGRGAQDMKCVCIQYMEALRKLACTNFQPERSIYLTFVPDEEIGGSGMAAVLDSDLYKNQLPGIALALDEGLASTNDVFSVFYGERLPWWIDVTAKGHTGHGSRFIETTAVEQLLNLTKMALAFREGQRQLLFGDDDNAQHQNCAHAVAAAKKNTLGDVTSLNITTLQAGVTVGDTFAYNCVPPTAKCSLDIRISPLVPPSQISDMLDMWCRECSQEPHGTLTWEYIGETGNHLQEHATTSIDTTVNPWYGVFAESLQKMGYQISPQVFPAATDSRFLRLLGIRALGFSPMRNTEIMLHENDEYIPEDTFVEGINVYVGVIQALSSQAKIHEESP
jgi:aminoacylase